MDSHVNSLGSSASKTHINQQCTWKDIQSNCFQSFRKVAHCVQPLKLLSDGLKRTDVLHHFTVYGKIMYGMFKEECDSK